MNKSTIINLSEDEILYLVRKSLNLPDDAIYYFDIDDVGRIFINCEIFGDGES